MIEDTHNNDEEISFRSRIDNRIFHYIYPDVDEITESQMSRIISDNDMLESSLYVSDYPIDDMKFILDMDSWAKWFLIQNILQNRDTNIYIYREDCDALIKMGPTWDFEWSLGVGWYDGNRPNPENYINCNHPYFLELLKNREFLTTIERQWLNVSESIYNDLIHFITTEADRIMVSQELNFHKWDIMNERISVGGLPMGSYEKELECDIMFLNKHIEWLKSVIANQTYDDYIRCDFVNEKEKK